jgi:hypothetical protein
MFGIAALLAVGVHNVNVEQISECAIAMGSCSNDANNANIQLAAIVGSHTVDPNPWLLLQW